MPPEGDSYQKTIDYIYGLQKHGIKLGLSNSVTLMENMGNPHRRFRSVHVAGTNGKGSTSAFIAGMLQAAGYRVGLYTSPHLVSFTERIRINALPITEQKVVDLARRVRDGYQRAPFSAAGPFNPTFFEVTTAIAFTFFAEEGVDIAVVEVGMGGRLDSTNVVTPLVSVITNINLEHTEFLGTSIELIASEKAGIIKPGVPVVTGAVQPEVIRVIEKEAAARQAPLYRMPEHVKTDVISSGPEQVFDYRGIKTSHKRLSISMIGGYQVNNACLALATVELLRDAGIPVDEPAMRLGLKHTQWEGRMERVGQKPDIYLDGAHNPASAHVLAGAIETVKRTHRLLILVIGILGDKDFRGIVSELVPLADHVVVTKPEYSRAMDLDTLTAEVKMRAVHGSVDTTETVSEAIAKAKEMAASDDLILITGSLYVVGDARAALVEHSRQAQALSGLKG